MWDHLSCGRTNGYYSLQMPNMPGVVIYRKKNTRKAGANLQHPNPLNSFCTLLKEIRAFVPI